MGGKAVLRNLENTEAFLHFGFHKEGGPLEALVSVLLINRGVMFLGVLAALENETHKGIELRVGVVRVVHMSWGLVSTKLVATK